MRPAPPRQKLFHEAMATTFSIEVVHEEPRYARQAATAAWAELDELESRLSRFVEGSDTWRINRLGPNQSAVVAVDTFRCLAAALEVCAATGAAFDVTYASTGAARPGERLALEPAGCRVRVLDEGVRVDLGGIGKGYALDVMAATLREWDVGRALLAASTSTILALDPPPDEPGWSVGYGPDHDLRRLSLSGAAISGSGIGVKGSHIVDPRTRLPARRVRAWARAPSAAKADALSTAFMVMSREEVRAYCGDRRAAWACLQETIEGRADVLAESFAIERLRGDNP